MRVLLILCILILCSFEASARTWNVDGNIYTNSNIGIGTISPVNRLEVEGSVYLDGSIYVATITLGNKANPMVIAGSVTLDPCPTLGKGAIFINATSGAPCFCNSYGVDLSLYNGTTACF